MNTVGHRLARATRALLTLGAALGSAAALCATAGPAAGNGAIVAPERAGCPYGPARQGRATCMTKADFDVAQSRQAALDQDPGQYLRNALRRCAGLPADDRSDCEARMRGGGTTSGSVDGGGIYRELVTREIGAPVTAAPTPARPAAPSR